MMDMDCYILSPSEDLHDKAAQHITKKSRSLTLPNRASISFLLLGNGISMIFTGDAPETEIIAGLDALDPAVKSRITIKHNNEERLHVEYMDIPHHGSTENTTEALFKKVTASYYFWSSDGGEMYPSTMGTKVLKFLCKVHDSLGIAAHVILSFPNFDGAEENAKPNSTFVTIVHMQTTQKYCHFTLKKHQKFNCV